MCLFNTNKYLQVFLVFLVLISSCVKTGQEVKTTPQQIFDFSTYLQGFKQELPTHATWKKSITQNGEVEEKIIEEDQFLEDLAILELFQINPIVADHYKIDTIAEFNHVKEIIATSNRQKDKVKLFKVKFRTGVVSRIDANHQVTSLIGRREIKLIWEGNEGYSLIIKEGKESELENIKIAYYQQN